MKGAVTGIAVLISSSLVTGYTWLTQKETPKMALVSPVVIVTPTIEITPTPVATISATPTPIASVSAEPKKKVAKKIIPTPTMEKGEIVSGFVDKYSTEYGLNPNVVRHLAMCESGFRTNATNGKYVGLFQYDSQTWIRIRTEMGKTTDPELRYSAEEAIRTTAFALSKGKSGLWPNCVP